MAEDTGGFGGIGAATPMPFMANLAQYMPIMSGGFGALGTIFSLIQNIQRMNQMAQLRKFYKNWQQAANQRLSTLVGDAASRGLSGSPNALAGLVASSYAPFQAQAGQGIYSTIPSPGAVVNPFDQFIKSLDAFKSLNAKPTPSDTRVNFGLGDTRVGNPTQDVTPASLDINE